MTIDVAAIPAQPHTDAAAPPSVNTEVTPVAVEQPTAVPAAPVAPVTPADPSAPPAIPAIPATPTGTPAATSDYASMVDALTLPDGADPTLAMSADEKSALAELAKTGEFSEAQLKLIHDQIIGGKREGVEQLKSQVAQWKNEVANDPELAGVNGDKLPETQANVERGFAAFGTPQLQEFFNYSGFGNHPMFVKLFAAIGDKLKGDSMRPAPNLDVTTQKKNPEDVLYKT